MVTVTTGSTRISSKLSASAILSSRSDGISPLASTFCFNIGSRTNPSALTRTVLVSSGAPGSDRALLQSPRLTLAIDALLRVYDHVLLDAGAASDLPAELLTANARAVVVPEASMAPEARNLMCDQLRAVGFMEVTMLSKPSLPSDAVEPGPRVVAA